MEYVLILIRAKDWLLGIHLVILSTFYLFTVIHLAFKVLFPIIVENRSYKFHWNKICSSIIPNLEYLKWKKMNTWKSPDNAEASLMQEILLRKVDTDNKCLIVTETSAFSVHTTRKIYSSKPKKLILWRFLLGQTVLDSGEWLGQGKVQTKYILHGAGICLLLEIPKHEMQKTWFYYLNEVQVGNDRFLWRHARSYHSLQFW